MKTQLMVTLICGILSATGCSSPQIRPANLDDFPGTEHMAKGPGLFSDKLGMPGGKGTVVYSSEKSSELSSDHGQRANTKTVAKSPSGADESSKYQEFEAFKAFQQFQQLPADAPKKKAFRQWLEWKGYLKWKTQQQAE